jgi:hypothetical protein
MQQSALILAAIVLFLTGAIHSYLGERVVFGRLFALPDLPLLRNDRTFTENVLRYAWHLTSLAWWGFAALLLVLAAGSPSPRTIGTFMAAMCLLSGLVIVFTAGRRHPAWPLFFLASAAIWYGTW